MKSSCSFLLVFCLCLGLLTTTGCGSGGGSSDSQANSGVAGEGDGDSDGDDVDDGEDGGTLLHDGSALGAVIDPLDEAVLTPASDAGLSPVLEPLADALVNPLLTALSSDDGGNGSDSGNDGCFDPNAYRVGRTSSLAYRRLDSSDNVVSDYTVESEVTRDTEFEGQPATEIEIQTTTSDSGGTTTGLPYWQYHEVDEASMIIRFLGFISETPTASGGRRTITRFEPPIELSYDMAPGDSRTQRFTTHTRTEEPPGQTTGTTSFEQELTFTYVGRTTITVPAGTYETCHMEHTQGSFQSTQYDHVGNGFMVRWDHPQGRDELVEAVIDGQRVQ